jgi:hypothetical protein
VKEPGDKEIVAVRCLSKENSPEDLMVIGTPDALRL